MRRRPSGSANDDEEVDHDRKPFETLVVPGSADKELSHLNEMNGSLRPHLERKGSGNKTPERLSRSSSDCSRISKSTANGTISPEKEVQALRLLSGDSSADALAESQRHRYSRRPSRWSCSPLTFVTTSLAALLLILILHSFHTRQVDPKGSEMSYMRVPIFIKFSDFDTEHTRFASKYSLYLHREPGIDEDPRVKGIPVVFIPGNAGSYKQSRSFASEAANYFHTELRHDAAKLENGKRPIDFFTVDFNEDITAFHGQTLLDQAEYMNEAVAYILSLYHDPQRSQRSPDLPDPTSVIIVGHSMGGIVARTMLTMPNYQTNSINTILTLSAPHARPPVSFDADIVNTYKEVNDYWRHAYSQRWANNNPLWHVTLVSIAGGGLDTVVPSDYASLASLVPPTHGFTVFTSSIPKVWTSMDHLEITFCNQLRKVIIRALYDVVDVNRAAQTRPRAERMRAFKRWFLTGLEDVSEKMLLHEDPKTLLTLEDNSNVIISQGQRLVLRELGHAKKTKTHLLPVPPQGPPEGRKFALMTNQKLDPVDKSGQLEVFFCSIFPLKAGHSGALFSMNIDMSGQGTGTTRLACKNAAVDAISLPGSTSVSKYPFDSTPSFAYLQYELEDLAEYQFVAVVDRAQEPTSGWVLAEFTASAESVHLSKVDLTRLVSQGVSISLSSTRPMVNEVKIPALESSLLAYTMNFDRSTCAESNELFAPLLRQHISNPYESKFFVNAKEANISLHGVAPYMPSSLNPRSAKGLSLQIWSDPTCNSTATVSLKVDILGSMGKLYMRYRTVFAAFPLLVVALVLRKQFKVYDEIGVFISFSESLDQCLRTSLPLIFIALTCLGLSVAESSKTLTTSASSAALNYGGNVTETATGYANHDILLGSRDTFFWFLVPFVALISVGICVVVNYVILVLTHVFAFIYGRVKLISSTGADARRPPTNFAVSSSRQRVAVTGILLLLVATCVPYHFAYAVLCIVQVATCIRALRLANDTHSALNSNFYNYAHSILVLLIWILPINLMVLIVWVRNLALNWLTPFSSHHNILAITPYILLVETLSTGMMIPRVTSRIRYITNILLFVIAGYAAIYGVTYAYLLHHLVNILSAWLVAVHLSANSFSLTGLNQLLEVVDTNGQQVKKRP